MSVPAKILFQIFVKPFYRENRGTFVFIFTMMFFIVSQQSGAGLFAYHYSLATGMLSNNTFLLFVFFFWLLYALKCVAFVSAVINKPEYSFIHIYNCFSNSKKFKLFFFVEVWLLMPILLYALFIICIGWQQHFYIPLIAVIIFLMLLCITPALWYVYLSGNNKRKQLFPWLHLMRPLISLPVFPVILIRFIINKQKIIWTGIKVFTCGILYLIARNNYAADADVSVIFVFFNFGIFANGIIVYRTREFEETYVSFYRGLPVSLLKRLLEYFLFYFILLIPEFITLATLVPHHLRYPDAMGIALCGYSLLTLMNSITFLRDFKMKEFLKILLLIFCVQYVFLMTAGLILLCLFLFIPSVLFFFTGYYKFGRSV